MTHIYSPHPWGYAWYCISHMALTAMLYLLGFTSPPTTVSDLVMKVGVEFASQKYLQIQMLEVDILVLTLCQRTSGYHFPGTCAREESREGERKRGREGGKGRQKNTPNWLQGNYLSYKKPHSYTYAPVPFSRRYQSLSPVHLD